MLTTESIVMIQNRLSVKALGDVTNALPTVYSVLEKFEGKVVNVRLSKAVNAALIDAGIPCQAELKRSCIGGSYSSLAIIADNRSTSNGERVIHTQLYSFEIMFSLSPDDRLNDWQPIEKVAEKLDATMTQCAVTPDQLNEVAEQILALAEQINELVAPFNAENRDIIRRDIRYRLPSRVQTLFKR